MNPNPNPNPNSCTILMSYVVGALFRFSQYAGLKTHSQKMFNLIKTSSSLGTCIQTFLRCKGFCFSDHDICHPLETIPGKLYLVQIASQLNGVIDNSHSICIYNGKIYDYNHTVPLSLTTENIDFCCVGTDWKFSHVSRVSSFIPGTKMKKLLDLML